MLLYTPPRSTLFPYPTLFRPPADALKDTLDHFSTRDAIPPMNMVVTYASTAYLSRLVPNSPPAPRQDEEHLLAIVNGPSRQAHAKTKLATAMLHTATTLTY